MNRKTANLLCLLVAVMWGGGFIATDWALQTFPPFTMLLIRFAGAAVLCWIPVCLRHLTITGAAWKHGLLSGVFLYLAFAFQTFGLQMTETGMNAFLTAVNVVLVPYMAWGVFRRRPQGKVFAASLICLAGVGCLSLSGGSLGFRPGDILSLLCAVFFAAQIVALSLAEKDDPWCVNAVQMTCAAALSVPAALIFDAWPEYISLQAVLSCGYSIFFATFLCYLLQTTAQKYTSPSEAGLFLSTESLWANIFGFLILKEAKTPMMILGGAMILFSVVLMEAGDLLVSQRKKLHSGQPQEKQLRSETRPEEV